jgi:hypothetical protein
MTHRALRLSILLVSLAALPQVASAQVTWRDLVFTMGVSGESYQGNLAAVTVPVVDSTDRATAAVGEFGLRGAVSLFANQRRSLGVTFDLGMRQFAAFGFKFRDYAPREWVGNLGADYVQTLGNVGSMRARVGLVGRSVTDRPPIPLYIQPGYGSASGAVLFRSRQIQGVVFDAEVTAERSEYTAPDVTPQLDLLDWNAQGVEVGAEWGRDWTVRVFGAYRHSEYPRQGSFDPEDPFRRDDAVQGGVTWTLQSPVLAQVGVEGTLNRSNSNRPEYDALSVRAVLSAPLPEDFGLDLFAILTGKSYLHETEFARLVPGEEADNASVVYVSLGRPLTDNLDAALRFGWTRAETDYGDSYYQRYGLTFLLHYRPHLGR